MTAWSDRVDAAVRVWCPYCAAPPGSKCTAGRPWKRKRAVLRDDPHADRIRVAEGTLPELIPRGETVVSVRCTCDRTTAVYVVGKGTVALTSLSCACGRKLLGAGAHG